MVEAKQTYRLSLSHGFGRVDGLKDVSADNDQDAIDQATAIVKAQMKSYGAQPQFTVHIYRPDGMEIAAFSVAELAAR